MTTTSAKYRKLNLTPYRKLQNGKPVPGHEGLIYPDDAAREGYQIAPSAEAESIAPGDLINVGTRYEFVPESDPRPGHAVGDGRKSVDHWRKVVSVGRPYEMAIDEGYHDDNFPSMSGFVQTASKKVAVRRVYFEQGGNGK